MTKTNVNLQAQIEGDLIAMLDEYHSYPEVWDNELSAQIAKWYSNPPKVFPKKPYFSPSSANSCPRELYVKAKGAKRDQFKQQPHQNRWKKIGTKLGDFVQSELLAIERNFEKLTGNAPRFKFERNADGTPRFEDFAKANKLVEHNGETFHLYGAPDGIMQYTTDDGELVRVGLEIKSKQGTPARTSLYSMKAPDESHAKQCTAYAHMFDCEYYCILYVNGAKQAWNMTDEQYEKTPDIRAFCLRITDEDKSELFDKFAEITKAVRENKPPKLNIDNWTFNNFKTECASSLTDEELAEIQDYGRRMSRSNLPPYKKNGVRLAIEQIEALRNGE